MLAPSGARTDLCSIRELRRVVCGSASAFDAGDLDVEAAGALLQEWAAIAHAAEAAAALAAARVATGAGPASVGGREAAEGSRRHWARRQQERTKRLLGAGA
jgi:hypothetical protein